MTFSRLEQAVLNKRRVADHAVEIIRVAIFDIFPPHKPDEWKDKSRHHGAWRHMLILWYDIICHVLRKLIGREGNREEYDDNNTKQSFQLTLKIPTGLMKWIEEIAQNRRMTIPEAAIYAIDYGIQVLSSQGSPEEVDEKSRQAWRDIWRAIWSRS
ncbi:MAG: hypothetical protein ABR577_09105 [Pyrinomonadaceae bacterium]